MPGRLRSCRAMAAIAAIVLLALARDERRLRAMLAERFYTGEAYVVSAYELVYLVSPQPLLWQLGTSMPRVLLQLWPSALLLFALVVESPPARGHSHPSPLASPG
jgi:hypothetical protein